MSNQIEPVKSYRKKEIQAMLPGWSRELVSQTIWHVLLQRDGFTLEKAKNEKNIKQHELEKILSLFK